MNFIFCIFFFYNAHFTLRTLFLSNGPCNSMGSWYIGFSIQPRSVKGTRQSKVLICSSGLNYIPRLSHAISTELSLGLRACVYHMTAIHNEEECMATVQNQYPHLGCEWTLISAPPIALHLPLPLQTLWPGGYSVDTS